MEKRVYGGKDKGNNSSSSTDASKRTLFCLISHVCKLESASKYEGKKLIENNWVEKEIRSSMKSNLKMPENIAIHGSLSWDAFFGYDVHEEKVEHQNSKCQTDVVYVPQEVNICVVLIEVATRVVVQLSRKGFLPTWWINCYVLVLNLSEATEHLS